MGVPVYVQQKLDTAFAWTRFPRIDNFGQIDPQGNYYKPDSNILTPPGFPVTNLYPGTVSSVQRTNFGQTVVTVRLDGPINNLATHTFYEHMHDASVRPGQHLISGDLLGHANYTGEGAALGVGLYSGDVYGSGSGWQVLQNDLKPGGAGKLNPTPILDQFKNKNYDSITNSPGAAINMIQQSQSAGTCAPWDIPCLLKNLQGVGESIAIFILALVLIIVGFFLIAEKQAGQIATKVGKAVALA
jgi:hypothetical protein